jgi:hypothetical protein
MTWVRELLSLCVGDDNDHLIQFRHIPGTFTPANLIMIVILLLFPTFHYPLLISNRGKDFRHLFIIIGVGDDWVTAVAASIPRLRYARMYI